MQTPDIYHHILNNHSEKLTRLGDIANVRRGITTGANEFFYLTADTIAQWGIEPQYLQPVMTTPQESRSLAVNPATLPHRLFICRKDKSELTGTKALAYIEWGESQGYHRRPSLSAKPRWYDLGSNLTTKLAFGCRVDTTSRTMIADQGLCFDKSFYKIDTQAAPPAKLCAVLNSTLTQLMINVEGRSNFGGGLLEIEVYETQNLPIINPQLLPEPNPTVFNAPDWDVLTPSAARRHIDNEVFNALSLTPAERNAIYEGVRELVQNRKRRATSLRSPAKGQATPKPQFRVVPNNSGFAPGVDPDQIKQFLYEMDMDDYWRKIAQ